MITRVCRQNQNQICKVSLRSTVFLVWCRENASGCCHFVNCSNSWLVHGPTGSRPTDWDWVTLTTWPMYYLTEWSCLFVRWFVCVFVCLFHWLIDWLIDWLTCLHIHDSEYDGEPNELVLGDEIEYTLRCKNGKVSAEMLVKLPQGTITQEQILPEVYLGKVVRSLRRADPQVQIISSP